MASLRTFVKPSRRAAARFVAETRRQLQKALARHPEIKRTKIADALGVHRSVITRQFAGTQDMTLGRAAELAWALGYEPEFVLHDKRDDAYGNEMYDICPAFEKEIYLDTESLPADPILEECELA